MNVLIIEDELPAIEKLENYLQKFDPSIKVSARCGGVEESVEWLRDKQAHIDLIFMDIQLRDGVSFEIFNKIEVNTPVIFITAFDEFAIDVFKVNGIDYLLKPLSFVELSNAMKRREKLAINMNPSAALIRQLGEHAKKNSETDF